MLGLIRKGRSAAPLQKRFGWDDLLAQVGYLNNVYPLGLNFSYTMRDQEKVEPNFEGLSQIYYTNGPVFACIMARMMLFSEARFQFQRFKNGRPGELYGSRDLAILEKPWTNGDTGEMLARAEQDASLTGNWYLHKLTPTRLRRLRPDWVTIVLGSKLDVQDVSKAIDAEVIAYYYAPPGESPITIMPEQMVHWSPIPDPTYNYRGMSWIPSAMADIQADHASAVHRQMFFEKAATPNFVVVPDKDIGINEFKDFRDDFTENYEGVLNAWKTIFLGGGSDIKVLGLDFEKMDFRNVQGAGETRIAAASGVPPIIAGFSEGLQSATYSNYGQARRKFGDHFARPQWRSVSNALSKFVNTPSDSRLWYDDRDIPFLREDLGDEANIRSTDAQTVRTLIEAGYTADAAVAYVQSSNLGMLLGQHSGMTSVQLQKPGDTTPTPPAA